MCLNKQETKELTIFQKYVVQKLYIKKLNDWIVKSALATLIIPVNERL